MAFVQKSYFWYTAGRLCPWLPALLGCQGLLGIDDARPRSASAGGSPDEGAGGVPAGGSVEAGGGCGNGRLDRTEECDGALLGAATCASLTIGSRPLGEPRCTLFCTFDLAYCTATGAGGVVGAGGDSFGVSSGSRAADGGVTTRDASGGTTGPGDATLDAAGGHLRCDAAFCPNPQM